MFSETKSEKLNKSTICIEKYCNKFFRNLPPRKYFKNINNNNNINSVENSSAQNIKNFNKLNNKTIEKSFKKFININKKFQITKNKINNLIIELKLKQNDFKNRRCIAISSAVAAAVFYTAIIFLLQQLFILNNKKTFIKKNNNNNWWFNN